MKPLTLPSLIIKTIVVHTVTYFVAGILAMNLMNYGASYGTEGSIMKPITDPMIMAGPLLQPVRGLIFALAFFPLRKTLFDTRRGWLILWWLLIALGILSTFGPTIGSIEGMIYTNQSISLFNYVEIGPQALALSFLLFYWINHSDVKWLSWTMYLAFFVVMLLPTMGLILRP